MENYVLNAPSGAVLSIEIDGYNASATIVEENAITTRYELKDLNINFKVQEIAVSFVECKYVADECLNASEDRSVSEKQLNYFLELPALDGNLIVKHCLNSMLFKLCGYRPFDAAGNFFDFPTVVEPEEA